MNYEEKIRVEFKDNTPRVVHFDKNKAPRNAPEIVIDDVTFWVEECEYLKATSKMYTASKCIKENDASTSSRYETAMLRYVLDDLSDGTFALMLYGFRDWYTHLDMNYLGQKSSTDTEESGDENIEEKDSE